ncbi:MAG: response regulator transcription factor [Bacteroidales bacterium]|nr:response regulator transcription factor [Bacteroidales bacterium]
MKKILIVEDEAPMLQGLKDNLEYESYAVDTASDGETGQEMVLNGKYDLILLDVMLPNISGFDICRNARKANISTPIILLTAKGEEIDKVLGLELGADDYITKPFSLRELLARIKAVLRRAPSREQEEDQVISLGRLSLNFKRYEAFEKDKPVKLSHKEFEIIRYLYKHADESVDRDDLMSKVWGIEYDITTRTVDNFILKLRQKIELDPNNPKVILTVHGLGYKLVL